MILSKKNNKSRQQDLMWKRAAGSIYTPFNDNSPIKRTY